MDEFLAKSSGETIVEHTNNLLKNFDILQKCYPEIPVNWDLLRLICQYHDLGKMNHLFQKKIRSGKMKLEGEIPHALLSIAFLPIRRLQKEYTKEEIKAATYAIALHHERDFSQIDEGQYEAEISELENPATKFPFSDIKLSEPEKIKLPTERYYRIRHRLSGKDGEIFCMYIMLKGLLNRIDYAASGGYKVEYPADFLNQNMPKVLENLRIKKSDPSIDWNDMQKYVLQNQNNNLIVIGQTGLGKTEAGLLWIGDNKGFFILPLRTAINAIYDRILNGISDKKKNKYKEQVGILHSDSLAVLLSMQEDDKDINLDQLESYLTEIRGWSLSLTVTTLDQTFDFVYHYAGFEQKLATFAYSKVVIDEIQMYSPDLLAYLIKGLKEIQDFGGKFLVMTATLPPYLLDLFKSRGLEWKMNKQPFLNEKLLERHHLQILEEGIKAEVISDIYHSGKLLVICNTVRKAKEVYEQLTELMPDENINLFHSQFIRKDRQSKENDILNFAESEDEEGIWVATQVVEASLDIDFDMLVTELSELNGLFQRMGRCYRKRTLKNRDEPNVYVFDGGEEVTSGVRPNEKAVVHQEIFQLSKVALRNKGNGIFSESEKMALINQTYITDNMTGTDYYTRVNKTLEWLDAIEDDNKNATEVRQLFRNIQTRSIIPMNVYIDNKEEIDELIRVLGTTLKDLEVTGIENPRMYKRVMKTKLEDYVMSMPDWLFNECQKQNQVRCKQIGKFEQVVFVEGEYSSDHGFEVLKGEEEDNIF
ncbi:CRISPR-associated helicase/endonuclease Cas3 [Enterococcus florum]|uniref:CRISPR-associated helicase/endonuclease Cas3 n=1 Tax=Enterococcus florum TaxID=2480627 RepID=A0A4P5P8Z1_9ENTE|nr:CRISPR-associated helicase Cas3' [Enterococcus florum]GCF92691.1 CRISPR-associated helicase/endonuclease Cas3 [Enterococcus florum]